MNIHIVVHHRQDPLQPWQNAWLDDDRIQAIQTIRQVADLCAAAAANGEEIRVHRCGWAGHPPCICCTAKVQSVTQIDRATCLVRFAEQTPLALHPPHQPAHGQNWYVA